MTALRPDPILRFALLVVALLPLCLWLWHLVVPTLNIGLAAVVNAIFQALQPDAIAEVLHDGDRLDVLTRVAASDDPGGGGAVFSVDPQIYSFGLPLFTALVLAVPGGLVTKLRHWLIGLPFLAAVQLWGVGFDIMKTLLFDMGLGTRYDLIVVSIWERTLMALAYQLGFLILPTVVPVAVWAVLNRAFLKNIAKQKIMQPKSPV
jgi:hypothetical protein